MFSEDEPLAYTESEHLHYRVTMTEEVNRATSRTISPAVEKHKALQDQTVRDERGEVKLTYTSQNSVTTEELVRRME